MENTCYILFTHGASVFLLQTEQGWALPGFALEEQRLWQDVAPINQQVLVLFGVTATTLNCIRLIEDPDGQKTRAYYVLENHTPPADWPLAGRWISRPELDSLPQNEQSEVILAWFRFLSVAPPPQNRVAWYLPGWRAQAQQLVAAQLPALGFQPGGAMQQIRSWQRASLWRLPLQNGSLYFKAVPPMFHFEPRLTQALAEWLTGRAPRVLAAGIERFPLQTANPRIWNRLARLFRRNPIASKATLAYHWFLMPEAGQQSLVDLPAIEHWEAAIRAFAEMQVTLTQHTRDLLEMGVPDRRLAHYPAWIAELLADDTALQRGELGLTEAEIARLRALQPQLQALASQLNDSPIPASLDHGDFWAGQVLRNGNGFVFIDWSDSSVSHPFLSTWFFLVDVASFLPEVYDAYSRLREAYLEPWRAFASDEQLLDSFELAQLLAPLHHAVIYRQMILPNIENQWEMERMTPQALRTLLGP
jgi:hypothetical protein